MASIKRYKTAKGHAWRVQYRSPDGRSRTKQGFKTKDAATAWAEKNAVSIRRGEWVAPSVEMRHVDSLWDGWIGSQYGLRDSSLRVLKASWRTHVAPRWGHVPVSRVVAVDVQEWVDELARERSATVVHRAVGVLRGLLDDAVRYRIVRENPCVGVRLPANKGKKMYVLTPSQLRLLVGKSARFTSLLMFLGFTGARWGEAVALTVGDVDLDAGRARISKSASTVGGKIVVGPTKTRHERTIAIPREVCEAMRADVRGKLPSALVWTNTRGGYVTTPSRRSWWHSAVDACQVVDETFPDITPHDLRHTAASMLIAAGNPVTVVARQLGHRSVKLTLDTYSHAFEEALADVVDLSWDRADKRG